MSNGRAPGSASGGGGSSSLGDGSSSPPSVPPSRQGARPALDSPPPAAGLNLQAGASVGDGQVLPSWTPSANNLARAEHLHDSEDDEDIGSLHLHSLAAAEGDARNDGGQDPEAARAAAESRAEGDRVSAALGQKLLQGWAMLDSYCPV